MKVLNNVIEKGVRNIDKAAGPSINSLIKSFKIGDITDREKKIILAIILIIIIVALIYWLFKEKKKKKEVKTKTTIVKKTKVVDEDPIIEEDEEDEEEEIITQDRPFITSSGGGGSGGSNTVDYVAKTYDRDEDTTTPAPATPAPATPAPATPAPATPDDDDSDGELIINITQNRLAQINDELPENTQLSLLDAYNELLILFEDNLELEKPDEINQNGSFSINITDLNENGRVANDTIRDAIDDVILMFGPNALNAAETAGSNVTVPPPSSVAWIPKKYQPTC